MGAGSVAQGRVGEWGSGRSFNRDLISFVNVIRVEWSQEEVAGETQPI